MKSIAEALKGDSESTEGDSGESDDVYDTLIDELAEGLGIEIKDASKVRDALEAIVAECLRDHGGGGGFKLVIGG